MFISPAGNWDRNGNAIKPSKVDTFFHGIQHSREENYDHITAQEQFEFQVEVNRQTRALNDYTDKWK